MKEDKLDHTRQQYLKRALSILVRCSEFDAVTSSSLDILCNVGILYMQSMFAQVHAYAEHATRTRPNMNDVGRALEERHVSVSQLDAYYRSEMDARQHSPIGSATSELCRQAALLTSSSLDSTRVSRESSVFFDNRAESLLCQLVGNHMERVKENRRKEELEEQAIKEAAAKASLSAASAPQIKKARSKLASRGRSAISSTGIGMDMGMGMGMDATSDEDNADDIDVDEDDDDASGGGAGSGASNQNRAGGGSDDREKTKHPSIRFNDGENGEDDDDEEDEDEDADFEAPEISMLRMQPPLSTAEPMSTAEAPPTSELDNHQNPAAAVVEDRSADIQLAPADSIVPADKRQARKRIQQLFPPANFRSVDKRTRLTSFIK
ncbi:transcription initiation factor TFIID subunit 8 [Kickxella alabastrina]|uniref:Transcription initiation factor TFIID subunit 8 n=1 Tax=Kickxella alabastrina TaxID=61397 RepID=A0ACC1IDM4_9FUNG|nr:transcription initiation factor TFIID subunit 8 [Kickxella alabastrina]